MAIRKKYRNLTIGEIHNGNNKVVPMLRISGKWFQELGFNSGDYVRVTCENGRIIITPNKERAEEKAAEKAFIEKEIAKLQDRYKKEKEEIHARYVAEQKVNYC